MKRVIAAAAVAFALAPSAHARAQVPADSTPTQQVGFVVRVPGVTPVVDLAGRVAVPPAEFDLLTRSVARWSKAPLKDVPVSIAVSPALCDQLHALDVRQGRPLLDALRRLAQRADVLTVAYADVWLPFLSSTKTVREQLTQGRTALDRCLERRPVDVLFGHVLHAGSTEPAADLDDEAVEAASGLGITTLVADGVAQTPVRSRSGSALIPFADSIPDLADDGTMREQPRSAHVVVVTDARKPDQFRSIVAIASSPAISAVAVRDLGSDAPHVDVAFPGDPPVDASMRRSVSRAEESAAAMSSVLLPDASLRTRLKAAYAGLLSQASKEAERALSDGQADRPAHRIADPITRFVESQLAKITVVRGSVTFTSRRGSVPVTVSNKTTYPVRVRVSVQSAKLAFPSGRTRVVTIKPPGDTITFVALATSSGTFPLTAAVKGPSGRPKIDQAELTVRSAAANLPAVILTAGGALFLLVVFGRRLGRRRREEREERA